MGEAGRIYRRTAAGNMVVEADDRSVPSDYRRILGVIEGETHQDVVRGCLRQFPDRLLAEWLAELEELGMLSSVAAAEQHDLDFTALLSPGAAKSPKLPAEDAATIARDAKGANDTLTRQGAFVNAHRARHREPFTQPPSATHVLVVEDDPDQLALADLRLSAAGYMVRAVTCGRDLMAALHDYGLPDILLLDVMLPDADGFKILGQMRRNAALSLLPIVMLTAKDSVEDVRKGLALGADGYITKPYSKNILAETIGKVLNHAPAQ
jgi:CheY-like chemotaxis protein